MEPERRDSIFARELSPLSMTHTYKSRRPWKAACSHIEAGSCPGTFRHLKMFSQAIKDVFQIVHALLLGRPKSSFSWSTAVLWKGCSQNR